MYACTCVEIGYVSPQDCLGCSIFIFREWSQTFCWEHCSLPSHYAFFTSAVSCRWRTAIDLPAPGRCGCDRPVAAVILMQGESVPCWLFLSIAAEYWFLLALPLLIPKHCRVTKWDPSQDQRLQTQAAIGICKLSQHLTSFFKSVYIIT